MLELTTTPVHFEATLARKRRCHVLIRTVGAPALGDPLKISEVAEGHYTGRVAYAIATHVETVTGPLGPMHVVSFELRMSSDWDPALTSNPTPVPSGES